MTDKIRNIFFLFGVFAVFAMFFTLDVSTQEMWKYMCKMKGWIMVVFAMWMFLYFMNALTLRTILKGSGDCNVSHAKLLKLTISGFALNYATPGGLMGGEPYKVMELARYVGKERATSSVLLFSMMHIFSHFWYWLISSLLYLFLVEVDTAMFYVLIIMALFSFGGIYLFQKGYRNGLVLNLLSGISRIPGFKKWMEHFINKHCDELKKIDEQIASLHTQNKRYFYLSFVYEFAGRVLQAFEIFFVLLAFGIEGSFMQMFFYATLIIALTSLFANLLFFLPLQLGGREGGFVMSCMQLGLPGSLGMFISVVYRIRELLWTAIGMLLIKIGNKKLYKL